MPRSALHSDGLTESPSLDTGPVDANAGNAVLGSGNYSEAQREMFREEYEARAKMRLLESRRRLGVRRRKWGRGSKLEDLMRGDEPAWTIS